MNIRERFDQRVAALRRRGDVAKVRYEPGNAASAETLARVREVLGGPLPADLGAFYESMDGVLLEWDGGRLEIAELAMMFGGHHADSRPWDDKVFEEVLWFDHFEDEHDPKTMALFRRLRLVESFEGVSMSVALDRAAPDALYLVDRWDLVPLSLSFGQYVDWALEMLGLESWQLLFTKSRSIRRKDFNLRFNATFPDSPVFEADWPHPLPKGLRKVKTGSKQPGARVVLPQYTFYTSWPRGTLRQKEGREWEVELDVGGRALFRGTQVRVVEVDRYERIRRDLGLIEEIDDVQGVVQLVEELLGEDDFGFSSHTDELGYSLQNGAAQLAGLLRGRPLPEALGRLLRLAEVLLADWPAEVQSTNEISDRHCAMNKLLSAMTLSVIVRQDPPASLGEVLPADTLARLTLLLDGLEEVGPRYTKTFTSSGWLRDALGAVPTSFADLVSGWYGIRWVETVR